MTISNRTSRNEKTSRHGNASSGSSSSSSGSSVPRGNSRHHGVAAIRGLPTAVPQVQVEKDPRAAARGAGVATNGGMPSDYQVRERERSCNFSRGLELRDSNGCGVSSL